MALRQRDSEVAIQRNYYARTAFEYDDIHHAGNGEHDFALSILISYLRFADLHSVLDVGSGTGRAVSRIKQEKPDTAVIGVEPSAELRAVGHDSHGLSDKELTHGNALALDYANDSFDIVCEFGMLHHIRHPEIVVREMLRVARVGIFISDSNNFGHGSLISRWVKQAINAAGLWSLANLIRTRGKGYMISAADGLYYSYSVFNNRSVIEENCHAVHVMNTRGKSANHYREADHVALLGIKNSSYVVGFN